MNIMQNKQKTLDWPAEEYAIGSFIQQTFSDIFIQDFPFNINDNLLDIGCGDGSYTIKISNQIRHGNITAIDVSSSMLKIANSRPQTYNNIQFSQKNILDINYKDKFSAITALWSLQWVIDLNSAFNNIYHALHKNGRFFAIMPQYNGIYMRAFYAVKNSQKFKSLEQFKIPVPGYTLEEIKQILDNLNFKSLRCEYKEHHLELPSLDIFRKFINGIGFYTGQIPDNEIALINEEMVNVFAKECTENFSGKYIIADKFTVINAIK